MSISGSHWSEGHDGPVSAVHHIVGYVSGPERGEQVRLAGARWGEFGTLDGETTESKS